VITDEQRFFMRSVFCEFENHILSDEEREPTDFFVNWIVTIYETGEPPQAWKMVKKIDEPAT
jgi:hypothetical protein